MINSAKPFFEAIEDWLTATQKRRWDDARSRAEFIKLAGQLLALDPKFRNLMHERDPGVDPQTALFELTDFLVCASQLQIPPPAPHLMADA